MSEEANDWDFFPPFLINSQDGILCMQETNICNTAEKSSCSSTSFYENYSLPSTSSTSKTRNDIQSIEAHMQKRDKKIGQKYRHYWQYSGKWSNQIIHISMLLLNSCLLIRILTE